MGLSGVPHLGTLSQIYRLDLLNKAGYPVQLVLGDLDAYCGKNIPLGETQSLSDKYERFILKTNMLQGSNAVVRNQISDPDALLMMYLLGRFVNKDDFIDIEERLHDFYASKKVVDSSMTFRRKLSLMLMVADFFSIGQKYPNVLVMLGIDEHKYVRFAQDLSQCTESMSSGINRVSIRSIYTPMIRGLNGYPKMSKSFPESGITLNMSSEDIYRLITTQNKNSSIQDDVVYQIICAIGLGKDINFSEIECAHSSDREWDYIKKMLAERIIKFAEAWGSL